MHIFPPTEQLLKSDLVNAPVLFPHQSLQPAEHLCAHTRGLAREVQEHAPARDGRIVRVETLNGRFLYACNVETGGFDLCLADVCMIAPGKASIQLEAITPPPEVIAAAEHIAQASQIDVGGVEYLVDDRDGSVKFYDINALSNFVADPVTVLGFDPHDALIDDLVDRIAAGKAAA